MRLTPTVSAPDVASRCPVTVAYDAAADSYDEPANAYWLRFGRRTVERLNLEPGQRVLDVCCGSGASAIPAAEAVGRRGVVVAVDRSAGLLELGRAKAVREQLSNLSFVQRDMLDLDRHDHGFDAVICVFGIFFAPDEAEALRKLWGMVRPGGQLAVTTWGPDLFEPASTVFWDAVREVRPDLYRGFNPWDRLTTPRALKGLFERAEIQPTAVHTEHGNHEIRRPQDWWTIVLGSGYRGTVEQLTGAQRAHVRATTTASLERAGIERLTANVVYAAAQKAGPGSQAF